MSVNEYAKTRVIVGESRDLRKSWMRQVGGPGFGVQPREAFGVRASLAPLCTSHDGSGGIGGIGFADLPKAAMNRPHSKRFALFHAGWQHVQRVAADVDFPGIPPPHVGGYDAE